MAVSALCPGELKGISSSKELVFPLIVGEQSIFSSAYNFGWLIMVGRN